MWCVIVVFGFCGVVCVLCGSFVLVYFELRRNGMVIVVDFIVEWLYDWGVCCIYGYLGDGINGFFGVLNCVDGKIEFI